jgi:putative NADPH-quinone reductase
MVLQRGFAFDYDDSGTLKKLLCGKSFSVIATMDAPVWFETLEVGDAGYKMLKASMEYCGIIPSGKLYFGSVKNSTIDQREEWLDTCYKAGNMV